MKKYLSYINIISAIIMFVTTLVMNTSENFFYIIFLTGIIGFIMPFIILLITGFVILRNILIKTGIVANFLSILMSIILSYFIIRLYNHKMLILLILYFITIIINKINILYLKKLKPINLEYQEIRTIKDKNKGIIK